MRWCSVLVCWWPKTAYMRLGDVVIEIWARRWDYVVTIISSQPNRTSFFATSSNNNDANTCPRVYLTLNRNRLNVARLLQHELTHKKTYPYVVHKSRTMTLNRSCPFAFLTRFSSTRGSEFSIPGNRR